MNKLFSLALAICLISPMETNAQSAKEPYKIIKKIKLSGDEGWDYLTIDSKSKRLYVSHGSQVQIADAVTGKEIGTIPAIGAHGIAIATELNKGFITNGKDSSVTIFDLNTMKVIEKVSVTGKNPDAILYDKFTQRIFSFNGRGKNATVINAITNKVEGTIALDGKPEFAATDNKGNIYVNIEDKSEVVKIDAKAMTVSAHWSIAPGQEPSGLAFDVENKRLFIGCDNNMMVIMDAENGKVVTNVPIGEGVDANAYDANTKLAFSSNGDGTLTVVHEDSPNKFSVLANVKTTKGARTMALDEQTHTIYLSSGDFEAEAPSTNGKKHKPKVKTGSFTILVLGKN